MGNAALRRWQIAKETIPFAAEAAVYRLVGLTPELQFDPNHDSVTGWRGAFIDTTEYYMTERKGSGSVRGPLLRDVESVFLFAHGCHSYDITGTGPYTYTFTPELDVTPSVPTLSAEVGDDSGVQVYSGGIVTEITLNGAVSRAVEIGANLAFGDVADLPTGFTTISGNYSAPDRKPPVVLTNNMALNIAGSPVGADLVSFRVTFNTGLALAARVNGQLSLSSFSYGVPSVQMEAVLRTGASASGLFADIADLDQKLFSLQAPSGNFIFEFVGQTVSSTPLGENEGASTMGFRMNSVYNSSLLATLYRAVVNAVGPAAY